MFFTTSKLWSGNVAASLEVVLLVPVDAAAAANDEIVVAGDDDMLVVVVVAVVVVVYDDDSMGINQSQIVCTVVLIETCTCVVAVVAVVAVVTVVEVCNWIFFIFVSRFQSRQMSCEIRTVSRTGIPSEVVTQTQRTQHTRTPSKQKYREPNSQYIELHIFGTGIFTLYS